QKSSHVLRSIGSLDGRFCYVYWWCPSLSTWQSWHRCCMYRPCEMLSTLRPCLPTHHLSTGLTSKLRSATMSECFIWQSFTTPKAILQWLGVLRRFLSQPHFRGRQTSSPVSNPNHRNQSRRRVLPRLLLTWTRRRSMPIRLYRARHPRFSRT